MCERRARGGGDDLCAGARLPLLLDGSRVLATRLQLGDAARHEMLRLVPRAHDLLRRWLLVGIGQLQRGVLRPSIVMRVRMH